MKTEQRIKKYESIGYVYYNNYNTGIHILKQALVKEEGSIRIIKTVENDGKINSYNTVRIYE